MANDTGCFGAGNRYDFFESVYSSTPPARPKPRPLMDRVIDWCLEHAVCLGIGVALEECRHEAAERHPHRPEVAESSAMHSWRLWLRRTVEAEMDREPDVSILPCLYAPLDWQELAIRLQLELDARTAEEWAVERAASLDDALVALSGTRTRVRLLNP